MILTLTLNPAIDQTVWVEQMTPGEVHRALQTHIDPAGKGVNVSRMTHRLGWPTLAFGFLAGETGALVERALEEEEVQRHFVRVPGQTRINTTVVDRAGAATSFYGPGPAVAKSGWNALEALVRFWLQAGRVLVLAGSLPPGVPEEAYAAYIRAAHEQGVRVILDADGSPMRLGVAAGPDLIKPNVAEAERLLGRALPGLQEIVRAGRELARRVKTVVLSMGAQGAVCVQGESAWRVIPPKVDRKSTVGSGDAMVAGLAIALARGAAIEEGLRLGAAAGAATAMSEGTALGTAEQVAMLLPQVQIEALA